MHNERCTPGSGAGVGETTAGDRGMGAPTPCSLTKPSRKTGDPLGNLNRAWERYRAQAEGLTKAAEKPEGLIPALGQHSKAIESLLGSVA